MAETVTNVFDCLSPVDQKNCWIFASDYDQAGAIDLYGPEYGLPKRVMSGRLTYYLWGYGSFDGKVMLSIGMDEDFLKRVFKEVSIGEVIHSEYAMPEDTNLPVYICRGLKISLKDFWKDVKNY